MLNSKYQKSSFLFSLLLTCDAYAQLQLTSSSTPNVLFILQISMTINPLCQNQYPNQEWYQLCIAISRCHIISCFDPIWITNAAITISKILFLKATLRVHCLKLFATWCTAASVINYFHPSDKVTTSYQQCVTPLAMSQSASKQAGLSVLPHTQAVRVQQACYHHQLPISTSCCHWLISVTSYDMVAFWCYCCIIAQPNVGCATLSIQGSSLPCFSAWLDLVVSDLHTRFSQHILLLKRCFWIKTRI